MRGKTLLLVVLAVVSLLSATAVAGGHRVVQGTKGGDELNAGGGADRVFARSGDDSVDGGTGNDRIRGGNGDDALFGGDGKDRLRGGQDNHYLDGGEGDDFLNGGGDGRDKDKIVCGDGYDVVVLGRNDLVMVEVDASGDVGAEDDDGCEKVKRPGGDREACASTGCAHEPCASTDGGATSRARARRAWRRAAIPRSRCAWPPTATATTRSPRTRSPTSSSRPRSRMSTRAGRAPGRGWALAARHRVRAEHRPLRGRPFYSPRADGPHLA